MFRELRVRMSVVMCQLFSRRRLRKIAMAGGNNPLVIIGTARWARIWWFSLVGIAAWVVLGTPLLKLMFFGETVTSYSFFHHPDKITIFNTFTWDVPVYWMMTILSGKLLQLLEIVSSNKMEYFKNHINYNVQIEEDFRYPRLRQ